MFEVIFFLPRGTDSRPRGCVDSDRYPCHGHWFQSPHDHPGPYEAARCEAHAVPFYWVLHFYHYHRYHRYHRWGWLGISCCHWFPKSCSHVRRLRRPASPSDGGTGSCTRGCVSNRCLWRPLCGVGDYKGRGLLKCQMLPKKSDPSTIFNCLNFGG